MRESERARRNVATDLISNLASRLSAARYELILVGMLVAVGAFLRIWQLESVPPGLHGDEANTGLRAAEILRNGLIGPYDAFHGLGQPAGAEYWTAGVTWVLGSSVFSIRFAMALLGILTIPLAYLLFRMIAGPQAALFGTAVLTVSAWHLYHSRVALPPVSMPFVEVLVALLLLASLKRRKTWLFAATGVALGVGIYTYNSYPYFVVGLGIFGLYWLATNRGLVTRQLLAQLTLTAVVAVLAAFPLFRYIAEEPDPYFQYARSTSIFSSEEFESGDILDKIDTVLDSGRDLVRGSVFEPVPAPFFDNIFTLLDPITAALTGLGILIAFTKWRQPGVMLALIMLFVMSLPAIFSTDSAAHSRRAIGVIPFVALLAALPVASLFEWTTSTGRARLVAYTAALTAALLILGLVVVAMASVLALATLAAIVVGGLIVAVALPDWPWLQQRLSLIPTTIVVATAGAVLVFNFNTYFVDFAADQRAEYHFNRALVEAAEYLQRLPDDTFVYFYADRWSFEYETTRFLVPELEGRDYSIEFGPETGGAAQETVPLPPPRDSGGTVYVFVGSYAPQIERVATEYPGGAVIEVIDEPFLVVRTYYLP